MDRLLVEGRYSTYSNSSGSNIPIERKRDIREDASWGYPGMPQTSLFTDQAEDIIYEYGQRKERFTQNDVISKQLGFPTHPITKALLTAEYQSVIDSAIVKTYGQRGWIESILIPTAVYGDYNLSKFKRKPLQNLNNDDLITVLFENLKTFTKYGDTLKQHFRNNTGDDLFHHLDNWPDGYTTNKNNLVKALRDTIISAYKLKTVLDVTNIIKQKENLINFSNAKILMLGEAAIFGGIQEVGIKGFLKNERIGIKMIGKPVKSFIEVELRFVLKDWFGVDEQDVYKNELSTQLDREGLAAFWILQHQRGYRPFINIITYKEIVNFVVK